MTRTITALFDSRGDAEAAAARLRQAGIDATQVHVHDRSTHKTTAAYSSDEDLGLWAKIKNAFLPEEDRHTYEEGLRRGGYLLTADVDEARAEVGMRALDHANSVDLDARAAQWRAGGWQSPGDGEYGTAVAGPSVLNAPETLVDATPGDDQGDGPGPSSEHDTVATA